MKRLHNRSLSLFLLLFAAPLLLSGQTPVPTKEKTSRPSTQAAAYKISGTVKFAGAPAPDIIMSGLPGNPITDRSGRYSASVEADWTGTVTPTLPGARFYPVQRTYVYVTADKPGQNYVLTSKHAPVCFYKHLLLFYPNSDIDYYQGGVNHHYSGSLTESHQTAITESFKNISYLTIDGSGNTAYSSLDIVVVEGALTTITPIFDHSYWVEPADILADLDTYAPEHKYDSIHVVWNSGPMESEYWGLGGVLLGDGDKKTTYSCLIAGAEWWWSDPDAVQANIGGVFLHEWLHGVCAFYRNLGYAMPERDADGGELHGYSSSTPEGWQVYYRDLMQGKVWEPNLSSYTGIGPGIWNDRTSSRHHGIYGQVLTERGKPLSGARLKFSNGIKPVISGKGGYYFQVVPDAWSGTVTPSLPAYLFNPPLWMYSNITSNQFVLDFIGFLDNAQPVLTEVLGLTVKEGEEPAFSISGEARHY